jgi:hypothetical protein
LGVDAAVGAWQAVTISKERRATVAAEARVSTAWLYSQEELRVPIVRSRTTAGRAVPGIDSPPDLQRLSKQNILATLRLRIKTLEEKNRELNSLLELACGELASARDQNASVGIVP